MTRRLVFCVTAIGILAFVDWQVYSEEPNAVDRAKDVAQPSLLELSRDSETAKTTTVDRVEFSVSMPPRSKLPDGAIATFTIMNSRSEAIQFSEIDNFPICHVAVTDKSNGQKVAATPNGASFVGKAIRVGKGHMVVLKPGEKKSWVLNIGSCFVLQEGHYELTVDLHSPVTAAVKDVAFACNE